MAFSFFRYKNPEGRQGYYQQHRCFLLSVFGLLVAGYLLYHHTSVHFYGSAKEPSICNISQTLDCDKAAESPYSSLFGVPVAAYGTLYYWFLIMFLLFFGRPVDTTEQKRRFTDQLFAIACLSLPSTVILFLLSWFVIKTFCIFCSLLYLVSILLVVVTGRSEWRSPGLVTSFFKGLAGLATSLLLKSTPLGAKSLAIFWLLILSSAFLIYRTPDLLREHHFARRVSNDVLAEAVDQLLSGEKRDMRVRISADLRQSDFFLGDPKARVSVVVFSDFRCPHCRTVAKYLESAVEEIPSGLQVVFKNFPLDRNCNVAVASFGSGLSCQAALMARCAGIEYGNDGFWRMHDALFEIEPSHWSPETLIELPATLGMDTQVLGLCMDTPEAMERIVDDAAIGGQAQIAGTPAVFINGRWLNPRLFHYSKISALLRFMVRKNPG